MSGLERFFRLQEHGTDLAKEVLAGVVTFFTMAHGGRSGLTAAPVFLSHGIVSYVPNKTLRGCFRDVQPRMCVLAGLLIVLYALRTGG